MAFSAVTRCLDGIKLGGLFLAHFLAQLGGLPVAKR